MSADALVDQLGSFGFSPYEAKVYYALLQKAPLNGYEVSRLAGIPPAKVYETLQRLQQKGAVLVYTSEPTLYAPIPSADLLARLRDHTERTLQTLEETFARIKPPSDPGLTWTMSGAEHILDAMDRALSRARQQVFAALWDHEVPQLEASLRAAQARRVEMHIALYGTYPLNIPFTYDLTLCGQSAQERLGGRRLSVVVVDSQETVVVEFTGQHHDQGIWTHNSVLALLAVEYVKEEIMGRCLINELGEERYHELRRIRPELVRMLRREERPSG